MENNEDNRQMTALQEHLRYLNGIRSEFVGYPGAESVIATLDRSIQNAESLLPKERGDLIRCLEYGFESQAEFMFNETFKPYEK